MTVAGAGFAGRTVLVTGAAGNLGRAVARAFAALDARLALVDLAPERLSAAYGADTDGQCSLAADLLDVSDVGRAVGAAVDRYGRIDVLCNLAGGFRMGPPVHETPDALWQQMLDLNARTVLHAARAVVPHMLRAGRGSVVNVAAYAAQRGAPRMGAYCAAKSTVIRLTESMSAELRDAGVNVNCVMPTILDTPENRADMPDADRARWVALDELAGVIVFLASDAARAIHGAAIPVG